MSRVGLSRVRYGTVFVCLSVFEGKLMLLYNVYRVRGCVVCISAYIYLCVYVCVRIYCVFEGKLMLYIVFVTCEQHSIILKWEHNTCSGH